MVRYDKHRVESKRDKECKESMAWKVEAAATSFMPTQDSQSIAPSSGMSGINVCSARCRVGRMKNFRLNASLDRLMMSWQGLARVGNIRDLGWTRWFRCDLWATLNLSVSMMRRTGWKARYCVMLLDWTAGHSSTRRPPVGLQRNQRRSGAAAARWHRQIQCHACWFQNTYPAGITWPFAEIIQRFLLQALQTLWIWICYDLFT